MTEPRRVRTGRARLVALLWLVLFAAAAYVVWSHVTVVDYAERRPSAAFGTIIVCVGPIVDRAATCLGEVHPGVLEVLLRAGSAATLLTAIVVGADWLRWQRRVALDRSSS